MRFQVSLHELMGARGCVIATVCALCVGVTHVANAIPEDPYPMLTISNNWEEDGDDWQEEYIVDEPDDGLSVSSAAAGSDSDPISRERSVLQLMLTTLRFSIR